MLGARLVLAVTALLFATIVDSGAESRRAAPRNQPPAIQPAQQPAPDQRGTDQSPLIVKGLPAEKSKEQTEKEDHERIEKAKIEEKIAFETQRIADYTDRLANFTLVLILVAVLQAFLFAFQLKYMRDDMRRSREDFIATNRPRVIIRFIQGPWRADDTETIFIAFVNTGGTDAQITAIGHDLARRLGGTWLPPGLNAGLQEMNPVILPSGQRLVREVRASRTIDVADFIAADVELCAVGAIQYRDGNNRLFETGFLRVLRGTQGFVPSQNAEDEYQD